MYYLKRLAITVLFTVMEIYWIGYTKNSISDIIYELPTMGIIGTIMSYFTIIFSVVCFVIVTLIFGVFIIDNFLDLVIKKRRLDPSQSLFYRIGRIIHRKLND